MPFHFLDAPKVNFQNRLLLARLFRAMVCARWWQLSTLGSATGHRMYNISRMAGDPLTILSPWVTATKIINYINHCFYG